MDVTNIANMVSGPAVYASFQNSLSALDLLSHDNEVILSQVYAILIQIMGHAILTKPGKCPSGFGFNEDGQCIPQGKCPDGYGRLDNDETGSCYPERDIKRCPDGSVIHTREQCPTTTLTPTPELATTQTPEPTPEPTPEGLTANCGGVPCTPTEKEDSTIVEEDSGAVIDPGSGQESLPPSP